MGVLVNFGLPSVNSKRLIFNEKEPIILEDYSELKHFLSFQNKAQLNNIRKAILAILKIHGLGYSETIYSKILHTELQANDIPFVQQTIIPIKFANKIIRNFDLKIPIIDNTIICKVVALKDKLEPDTKKIRTYLKDTNLPIGLLVNFGKEKLEIIGIRNYST